MLYTDIEYVFKVLSFINTYQNYNEAIYLYNIGYAQQSVNYKQFISHIDEHEKVCKRVIEIYDAIKEKNLCIEKNKVLERLLELVNKHYSILFMLKTSRISLDRILEFSDYIAGYEFLNKRINLKRIKLVNICNFLYYPVSIVLHLRSAIYRILKFEV